NEGGFDWLWAGSASTFSITMRNGSGTGSTEPKTTANYNPGQWYHVVTTFDGTNIAYYINGVQDFLQNSPAATLNPNTWAPLTIGGGRWTGTIQNQFQGQIDELAVYTNILSQSDIQTHYNDGVSGAAGVYKAAVLADQPLLYYRMDSPAYATPARSSWPALANYGSGGVQGVYKPNAAPGALAGPSESGIPLGGFPNTALASDGNSIFADAGFDPSFNPTGNTPLSVTAWFRANPADVQQRNWQTLVGHTDQNWRCAFNGGNGKIGFDSGNGLDVASAIPYNDGQWHQVVGTYDGTSLTSVYVDGKLSATGTKTGTIGTGSLFDIYLASSPNGQSNAAGGRTFAGNICEAAFFNGKALTAQQVSNLYNAAQVPAFITTQPNLVTSANQNSCYTNTVVANGSGTLSYQWYENGVAMTGQTNASLVICPVTPAYASTNLYVVVSNSYGAITSSIASLTVFSLPQFVVQPTNTTLTNNINLYAGAHPTFKAYAVGAQPITYQWYTNGVLVPGATNISYTLPPAGGVVNFACVASNFVGTSTTSPVNITVLPSPVNPYPIEVTSLNPIAYWRLNEPDDGLGDGNSGAIVNDYVGGINGVYTNTALGIAGYNSQTDPTETAAEFGFTTTSNSFAGQVASSVTGLNLGLTSNLVYGVDFAATNQNSSFSISAWVNGGQQTADAGIVAKGVIFQEEFGLDTGYDGGTPAHAFRFFVRTANGNAFNANSTIQPGNVWHHLVGVCDEVNGVLRLYVDGQTTGSATLPANAGILSSTGPLQIGARPGSADPNANTLQFVGTVDDVAVFNRALSALEVSNLYFSAGIAPSISQQPPSTVNVNENGTLIINAAAVGTQPLAYQWFDQTANLPVPNQTNATLVISNFPLSMNGETYVLNVTNLYGNVNSSSASVSVQSGAPVIVQDLPTNAVAYAAGSPFTLGVTVSGTAPFAYTWYEDGSVISGATNSTYTGTTVYGSNTLHVAISNSYGGVVSSTAIVVGEAGTPPVTFPNSGSAGWTLDAQANGFPVLSNGVLQLTDGGGSESRQAWFNTKQDVSRFLCQFIYQDITGGTAGADGITFCIQNIGTTAEGGGGGSLGVSGITPSVDFAMNIYHGTTPPGPAAGWNLNGGNATTPTSPLVLDNGSHPIHVVLYYNGTTATAWLTDPTAGTTAPVYTTNINIPTLVGNPAYVGFTGATGGSQANQEVYDFSFATITTPVLSETISGNNVVVAWPSSTSALFTLQSAANVNGPWSDVTSGVTASGGQVQYVTPVGGSAQFYRLVLRIP
ncbi:MAG TPA: LamG-like jellyroll fold domain-containing protein, partial [Verrucomicrobiae bacterium]|nr:LamG-like jellyroll fold domain-containing protein [Verrucomicrobiae bacterium]